MTCGGGTQERNRSITQHALFGGNKCIGDRTETQFCNSNGCPGLFILMSFACSISLKLVFIVNCVWGPWSVWEACSVTCGGGTLEINRAITQKAKYGGNECAGNDKETLLCSTNGCPGFNNLSYVFVLGSGTHKNI